MFKIFFLSLRSLLSTSFPSHMYLDLSKVMNYLPAQAHLNSFYCKYFDYFYFAQSIWFISEWLLEVSCWFKGLDCFPKMFELRNACFNQNFCAQRCILTICHEIQLNFIVKKFSSFNFINLCFDFHFRIFTGAKHIFGYFFQFCSLFAGPSSEF